MSGRFLKTKHCQNHEQDTWPKEFSKGKNLRNLTEKTNECLSKLQSMTISPSLEGCYEGQVRPPLKGVIVTIAVCTQTQSENNLLRQGSPEKVPVHLSPYPDL